MQFELSVSPLTMSLYFHMKCKHSPAFRLQATKNRSEYLGPRLFIYKPTSFLYSTLEVLLDMTIQNRQFGRCLFTAGIVLAVSQPVFAGSSWLSSVTMEGQDATQIRSFGPQVTTFGVVSSASVFNITISLEENPLGDDTYPADSGTDDDDQNRFEAKIEEFADAVFQMTNGRHKIGTVTMFRDGAQANNVDVQWIENCASGKGPRANPSGFGVPGKRIYFCTNWVGAPNLMDTPKGAGFTLAHEWGHYTYGVFDEYVGSGSCNALGLFCPPIWFPQAGDTPSVPSIMNNQWNAVSGSQDYLEFSTNGVAPYSNGQGSNAQSRTFLEPAWETLTRAPGTDPRHSFLASRTQYSNLVAPPVGNGLVNDNESTARSELNIVWAGDQVVELMIDNSGSMRGLPIDNARNAASLLVGQLTEGESAVGVGRFASSASQIFPITDVPNPDTDVRSNAQTAINGIVAGGGTDIQGAALTALSQVQNFQAGVRPSVVFLLTDGQSFVNQATVISQYVAARVPLITFGFGDGVDDSLLRNLAGGTGGQYFFSPTNLAEIQQAFIAANAAFSSNTVVSSSSSTSTASSTDRRILQLDSTLASVSINATYALPETDISLTLVDSDGNDTGAVFTCSASSEVSCETQVDVQTLGSGEYGVEVLNNSTADKDVSVLVSGTPSEFESYEVAVEINDTTYPENFSIRALVSKGSPLSGLDVIATVTRPDGSDVIIQLLDDGLNSDLIQADGIYSGDIPYDQNGSYTTVVTASNAAGNAISTNEGLAIAVHEDGSPPVFSAEPVVENFTRVAVNNALISNVQSDDHGDDLTNNNCTGVFDDNIDTVGRIDFAGDVDCFNFVPSDLSSGLVIRVTSLRDNIQPKVQLFSIDGSTSLAMADLSTSPNPSSGVIHSVLPSLLASSGHIITIEHEDSSSSSGGYAISIGQILASDGMGMSDDIDGDTVLNDMDMCPATVFPENSFSNDNLSRNRFALIDDQQQFTSTSRRNFSIQDTAGCSCEQILDQPNFGGTRSQEELFGCTASTMSRWERIAR